MSDSMFVCGSLLSDHVHILVSLFGSSLSTRKTSSGLSAITSPGHSAISLVFWSFLVSFSMNYLMFLTVRTSTSTGHHDFHQGTPSGHQFRRYYYYYWSFRIQLELNSCLFTFRDTAVHPARRLLPSYCSSSQNANFTFLTSLRCS